MHRNQDRQPLSDNEALRYRIAEEVDSRLSAENLKSSLALGIAGFAVLMVAMAAITVFLIGANEAEPADASPTAAHGEPGHDHATDHGTQPTAAVAADDPAAQGVEFEKYQWVDPTLPEPPAGEVKRFEMDVYEHVTKVADDLAPTRVWSYAVNGTEYRGTGVSAPMVVTEGDMVEVRLHNGSSKKMAVKFPHSVDFHSSELAPNVAFATIPPGETHTLRFRAKHPGVFMYHCATQPVLHHTAAGMVGPMIVKPKDLAPVDRELWITQQEYYLGEPGADADYAKAQAGTPDVIAFNGYANQYAEHKPIKVKRGERIRMYVLNAGPSKWSAFHVIGTVFDRAVTDNGVARHAQTVNLAPSQGGYVEFTLDKEGSYPFVTHSFADMEKGAVGSLATEHAKGQMEH